MKNNIELRDFAKKFLGQGGYTFRSYCGLGSGSPWCNAFVTYIMHKGGFASLYCNGKKQTYCPNSIKWCQNNLADIPIYLALPMDIVYFDWEGNGVPNHIGFAWERNTDQSLYTIEGNTSGGIVARKTRSLYNKKKTIRYIQAVFRPHYSATFDISKPLTVDGYFGYSSIALLQKVLGLTPDGILGKGTVKALQKIAGVSQDGSWGKKTSKAVQKMVGVDADGEFGPKSVKALQTWINKKANFSGAKNEKKPETPTSKPATAPATNDELVVDGHGGPATVKAMQRFFECSQDGVISGQNESLKRYYPALEAVEFGKNGSVCITRLQRWVGANEDGILGQITVKLWQKKIGVKEDGYFGAESMRVWQKYLNEHDKAVYSLIDKELEACKTQANWMRNSKYKWESKPTIEKSKKAGTCVTYVACVLQRIGVLKSGQYVWHDEKGKVYGANDKMTVTYPKGKTLHQIKSQLKAGDIVMDGSKNDAGGGSHIFILTGRWNGNSPIVWDNHSAQQGKGAYTYSRNRSVIAILRLK